MRNVPRSGCGLATLAALFLFAPVLASAQNLRTALASLAHAPVPSGGRARPARTCASVGAPTVLARALAAVAAGASDTIFAQGFDDLGGQCLTPNDCPDAPCAVATCTNGFCGQASACAFGCDAGTACADLVPANQASAHLQSGDVFTCTGSQSALLGSVTAPANATVVIDTQIQTITVNGAPVTGIKWGAPYAPTGSGTNAVVAHVQSVTLGDGVAVTITGANALILLVDQDFDATGTAIAPTVISAAANLYTTGGPGAPSVTAGGAGSAAAAISYGAGGGSGHGAAGGKGGGGNNVTTGGGAAGASYGMTAVLEAGENGGAGNALAAGGRGGGGVQISACGAVSLGANVTLNASGGGGQGGSKSVSAVLSGNGGGGGGAGGTLILEASSFAIAGALVSNGGGGGGGGATSAGSSGTNGQNWGNGVPGGTPVTTAAQGGTTPGALANPGDGGDGGAGIAPQGVAGANAGANIGGGAGGGACGAIFLNVPPGSPAPTVGAASPDIRTSTTCVTQGGVPPASCTYP